MKTRIIEFENVDWSALDGFADRTVFQTRQWIQFIGETQNATPVIAELCKGRDVVGYFAGLTFTRLGVKILGSSFPGWTTPYIGFNMLPGASRSDALVAVEEMAWGSLKCLHMEISDPQFTVEDGESLGFTCEFYSSYRTDLRKSDEELFSSMDGACRRCIRKAEKIGVIIEEAHDLAFADEYYQQLVDVFAKQGLIPTYKVDRVRALIRHLEPTGRILLLRARDPDGKCIATGIFPGFNKIGVEIYDWGGEGKYKEKYGCAPHRVPWFTKSRFEVISKLRDQAKKMFDRKQRFLGWLQGERQQA
jgi:hypothetical protein